MSDGDDGHIRAEFVSEGRLDAWGKCKTPSENPVQEDDAKSDLERYEED